MKRCECVTCGECHGLGRLHDPFVYSDFDYEPCFDCDGSGITEECDYCIDHREMHREEYEY